MVETCPIPLEEIRCALHLVQDDPESLLANLTDSSAKENIDGSPFFGV